jgi:two-component system nitrate/nitrite sensor histidine kinase NarX
VGASCGAVPGLLGQGASTGGLGSEAGLRAPMERLLQALTRLGGARAAVLRTRDGAGEGMQVLAACEIADAQQERISVVKGDCGVCATALQDGAVRVSRASCGCTRELASGRGARVIAVPVRSRGDVAGVLSLFLDEGSESAALPPGIAELLPALGDVLGMAMENALLSEADLHAGLMLQRHLIANEVHDSLAQNLASIRMRTSLLRDAFAKRDTRRAAGYLGEIDESLALAQSRVREIITDFRSQMGATQLVPALEHAIDELRAASGIDIEFDNSTREPSLSAFEQVQVFYIAREALTNALKHAKARRVRVALAEVGESIELRVEDDGVGLDRGRASARGHFGLNIMHERAARLGGAVAFEHRSGGGTRVQLRFPSRMAGHEMRP